MFNSSSSSPCLQECPRNGPFKYRPRGSTISPPVAPRTAAALFSPPPTSKRATPPPPRCARAAAATSYKSNGQSAAVPETSSLPLPFLPRSRLPTPLTPLRVSYGAYAPIPLFHVAGSPPPMFPHIPDLLAQLSQAGRYWRRARRDGWLAG